MSLTTLALRHANRQMAMRRLAAGAPMTANKLHMRAMSSYSLDSFRGGSGNMSSIETTHWPLTKMNTIFNIVPQGERHVVERLGKLSSIEDSGWFLAIPFVDSIAYIIDVRERAMDIQPQAAITRDNVSVEVSGNLFIRFIDPERAAYGAKNPLYSVIQHAQSAMRAAIGEMELDEILHGRAKLNALIKGTLQEASSPWGIEIRRYEITEITPDEEIRVAMDKQAAAERDRRQQVLRATADKERAQLTSEGVKISLQNESEGNLIRVRNEADATKTQLLKEAEGRSEAIQLMAEAQAQALAKIAAELQKPGGADAAQLALARDYVAMYGEMGKESNTMIFNDRPAHMTSLLTQAVAAMKAVPGGTPGTIDVPAASASETAAPKKTDV